MSKEFEGEVKKVTPASKPRGRKRGNESAAKPPKEDDSDTPEKGESPLKTVGGTPIIEREPG